MPVKLNFTTPVPPTVCTVLQFATVPAGVVLEHAVMLLGNTAGILADWNVVNGGVASLMTTAFRLALDLLV